MEKFTDQTEHAFYDFLRSKGMTQADARRDVALLRQITQVGLPLERYVNRYLAMHTGDGACTLALRRFRAFLRQRAKGDPMALLLKDFIGRVVVEPGGGKRYAITCLENPRIGVVTLEPDSEGHRTHYSYPTVSGDPFRQGRLVFEDPVLDKHFARVYDAHCRSQAGYWESYGYWLRRD